MGIKRHIGALAVWFAAALPAAQAELDMVEGYWETTANITIRGGAFPVPAVKSAKCLTRADPLPNSQQNMRCRVTDRRIEGDDVSWRVECSDDKATTTGRGRVTYAGTRFSGELDLLIRERGSDRKVDMKYQLRGERVRACDASER